MAIDPTVFEHLRSRIGTIGEGMLQKKIQERQRQQALQDLVLKSELGKRRLKEGIDIPNVITPEGQIDLSQFERQPNLFDLIGNRGINPGASLSADNQNLLGQRRMIPKGISTDEEGNIKFNMEFMPTEQEKQEEIIQAAKKSGAIEAAKPYTEVEAGVIAKGELLTPQIDKLINLIEQNKVYEGAGVPFGASRIAAFGEKGPWQGFKRGLTAGKGREAGLLLKDIKILAFGEGGKTLSENERMTALSNIDPSYKTEEQWVEGLKQAKALLLKKAELMKKNKFTGGRTNQYQIGQLITKGGKQYQVTGFDTDGEPLVDMVK